LDRSWVLIKIGNHELEQVKKMKYLGVIFDDKLSWKPHIEHGSTNFPARIFGGGSPDIVAILQLFSKKYILLSTFWPTILLKNAFFKCLNKVC